MHGNCHETVAERLAADLFEFPAGFPMEGQPIDRAENGEDQPWRFRHGSAAGQIAGHARG